MEEIIKDFLEHLYRTSIYIGLEYAGVFLAMGVDLIFGIKKAKEQNIDRTSTALKKTATKGQKYFSPMLCLTIIDVMTCMHVPLPVFTLFWAGYCVWCEFKYAGSDRAAIQGGKDAVGYERATVRAAHGQDRYRPHGGGGVPRRPPVRRPGDAVRQL